jgi:uncharacterized protein
VPSIVVDAGPLIALFDRDDKHHTQSVDFLRRAGSARLITTSLVVGEVAAMLSDLPSNLFRFLEWVTDVIEIDDALHEDLPRTVEIMKKYGDLPADLADVSLITLCERRRLNTVATIDRDFAVYRLPKGKKFQNAFFETKAT